MDTNLIYIIIAAIIAAVVGLVGLIKGKIIPTPTPSPTPAPTPTPTPGFGSNSNYIMAIDCNSIMGTTVTVKPSVDMVSSAGFSVQLNGYSKTGFACAYQQYGFLIDTTGAIFGFVDNWPVSGDNIVNYFTQIATLPTPTLPAGYSLITQLQVDINENVVGVVYSVLDNLGNSIGNLTIPLVNIPNFQSQYLAPLVAYELNIVGPDNGQSTVFSSGEGTITYQSLSTLIPLTKEPSCTSTTAITAETANDSYGALPATASVKIVQPFSLLSAVIMKPGNFRRESIRRKVK